MNSLDVDIGKILESYTQEVKENLEQIADEVADETIEELKRTSPKDTGKYSRAWKKTEEQTMNGKKVTVHNSKGQLTHLLENGHATVNGGRTRSFPHIAPAEENAKKNFEKKLRDRLGK